MRKKVYFSVLITLTALAVFLFIVWLSNRNLTSHHASINVQLSESDSSQERFLIYEKVIEAMKVWAKESDMYLVTNPDDKRDLSSFTTNPDADMRECYFKDKLSSDGSVPLQVMSSYDVNGLQIVRIMFSEGYSKEPSDRLKKISNDLYKRLVMINEETYYSIW